MKNEEFPSYSDINYVDQVSCKEIIHYFPSGTSSHSAANSSFFFFSSSFLNEIVSQLHLGIIHVFADRMFFVFTANK